MREKVSWETESSLSTFGRRKACPSQLWCDLEAGSSVSPWPSQHKWVCWVAAHNLMLHGTGWDQGRGREGLATLGKGMAWRSIVSAGISSRLG